MPAQQSWIIAMRLSALWKPNERRVMVRTLPFKPSTRAFDRRDFT